MGRPPKPAAPLGLCSLFLLFFCIMNIYGYSLYITYLFLKYVPYVFPCVFLNLWSQQKKNLVYILRSGCVYIYICIYVYTYIYIYIICVCERKKYTDIYIYIYIYICIYVYIYIYIHGPAQAAQRKEKK